jgi:hypothetical protein
MTLERRFRLRRVILASLCLAVAACAVNPSRWQDVQDGPRARVRFATDGIGLTVLYAYDDIDCRTGEAEMMRLRMGPRFDATPRSLGMPSPRFHDSVAQEVVVKAGRVFVGRFEAGEDHGLYGYNCVVPFAFQAEPGADYEVVVHPRPQGCNVSISRYVPDASGATQVPLDSLPTPGRGCRGPRLRLY